MREAAIAAFDVRRPGVEVLRLAQDTHVDPAVQVLRFAGQTVRVEAVVHSRDDVLRLSVSVRPESDLVLGLEQLAPTLRLVSQDKAPATFDDVQHGFVSITGTAGGADRPDWCTAWTRI